jgi:hypothetical protein
MKTLLALIFALFLINGAFASSESWKLSRSFEEVEIWKEKNSDSRLVLEKRAQASWPYQNIDELMKKKKKALDLMGISHWSSRVESNDKSKIEFSGSYIGPDGKKIFFFERHEKDLQMLLTSTKALSLKIAHDTFQMIQEKKR